ncbi:MAG TPA: hypothetical protein VIN71_02185, partial [Pseudomonadales bacterium]
ADAGSRIIVEIDSPYDVYRLKKLGYRQFIWVLDDDLPDEKTVLDWIRQFDLPFAISLPPSQADSELAQTLARAGITLYVRSVNDARQWQQLQTQDIAEIYTGTLPPQLL